LSSNGHDERKPVSQESRIVAISAESPHSTIPCRSGGLTARQFATLRAIVSRIVEPRGEELAGTMAQLDYPLGLDELDTISRTRTTYAFAELPEEIQDAILGLITTRDLTSQRVDLAAWLEQLYVTVVAG
jgi:hypothetical protein